ncbi:heterokaryon incompatibility protein [Thelonectria olida]|uniref:Heterokaryon incompatibility protein n=1 Tax=Thelonectria olida TaxID=1576542 RepID=A0A9P8WJS9_9HYPO|nr:heterokaryon incompatibility protein [Thelonectria olida]
MLPLLWPPTHPPYKYSLYSPLDSRPGAFRLVRLLPPLPTLWGNTLRIQLIAVDNVGSCAYDTLSYTWGVTGKDPPDRRILVETPHGSREFRIYRPLEIALSTITTDRPLFVDQICINQDDEKEKASQVQLMRDIYGNCTRLLVWLGPGTTASDQYFDCIRQINAEGILHGVTRGFDHKHFMKVFDAVMNSDIPAEGDVKQDRDDVLMLISKYGDAFPLEGAKDVLSRKWWQRLWIIQEACLAPNVLFVCGSQRLCFDCLRLGLLFYNLYNTHWSNHVTRRIPESEANLRRDLLHLNESPTRMIRERKMIHQFRTRHSLYDIVLNYNVNGSLPKIGATLAEDRIFGVMGMAEAKSLAGLRVSYNDTRKVFIQLGALLAAESLDLLFFSQFPKTISTLPSWAPDWSMDLHVPCAYMKLQDRNHSAGEACRGAPTVDIVTGCLTVRGIVVDIISEVGKYEVQKDPEATVFDNVEYTSVHMFLGELDKFLSQSRVSADDVETAASHIADFGISFKWFTENWGEQGLEKLTLVRKEAYRYGEWLIRHKANLRKYYFSRIVDTDGRLPWYWLPVNETDALMYWATSPMSAIKTWMKAVGLFLCDAVEVVSASTYIALLNRFLRIRRKWRGLQFNHIEQPDSVRRTGLTADAAVQRMLSEFADNLIRMVDQRIYLTDKGYIGTGPRGMKPGDVVVVLFGMTCPIVLRKHASSSGQDGWSYLGAAYCYGVMNGEVLQDGKEVTFNLV